MVSGDITGCSSVSIRLIVLAFSSGVVARSSRLEAGGSGGECGTTRNDSSLLAVALSELALAVVSAAPERSRSSSGGLSGIPARRNASVLLARREGTDSSFTFPFGVLAS